MIHVSYDDISYKTLYPKFAKAFAAPFEKHKIVLPPHVGNGYFELVPLGDELFASIENFHSAIEIKFCRKKRKENFYILHFDELKGVHDLSIQIDGEVVGARGQTISTAMLTSNQFDFCYILPKGSKVRSLYILLTEEWMKEYLELDSEVEVLKTYLSLRMKHLNREPFNPDYRKYFAQIFETPEHKPLRELHLRNSIMMLIEVFFSRLFRKMKEVEDSPILKMDNKDLYKLMEVEWMLVKDFSKAPPTITDLATYTNMSVSKLKSAFKKVYGTGIYEYFQKSRMHKARTLLVTNGFTVKEVGMKLGYTNLSNFSLAFKKEFGVLPSHLQ